MSFRGRAQILWATGATMAVTSVAAEEFLLSPATRKACKPLDWAN